MSSSVLTELTMTSATTFSHRQTHSSFTLPRGWEEIVHDSGLPMFINTTEQIVCWSRPYVLMNNTTGCSFHEAVKVHKPPIHIFSIPPRIQIPPPRIESSKNGESLMNKSSQSMNIPTINPQSHMHNTIPGHLPKTSTYIYHDGNTRVAENNMEMIATKEFSLRNSTKRRKNPHMEPTIVVTLGTDGAPSLIINGRIMPRPDKSLSAHLFLKEFCLEAWSCAPNFIFAEEENSENVISCCININGVTYPRVERPTKQGARLAASEAFLEKFAPGYWKSLEHVVQDEAPVEKLTFEEFCRLPINDPRVIPLLPYFPKIRKPSEVLHEYEQRNRGVVVNHQSSITNEPSTVTSSGFRHTTNRYKSILSTGRYIAEGVGSSKKLAKHIASQKLLALLHQNAITTYVELSQLYCKRQYGVAQNKDNENSHTKKKRRYFQSTNTHSNPFSQSKAVKTSNPFSQQHGRSYHTTSYSITQNQAPINVHTVPATSSPAIPGLNFAQNAWQTSQTYPSYPQNNIPSVQQTLHSISREQSLPRMTTNGEVSISTDRIVAYSKHN